MRSSPRHPLLPRRRRLARRSARTTAIAALGLVLSHTAHAQTTAPRATPVIRTLIGDVAIVMRSEGEGTIGIGAAGATRTLSLSVRATDARRWADSAARLVAPVPRRRTRRPLPNDSVPVARRARAVLEEPGVGAGSFVLTRLDSADTRSFLLFIDDAQLDPLRQPLDAAEAATLVRLVRKAATPLAAKKGRKATRPSKTSPPRTSAKPRASAATARPAPLARGRP